MKELSDYELQFIFGGDAVPSGEYCETLDMLISNNWDSWDQETKDIAAECWNKYCS